MALLVTIEIVVPFALALWLLLAFPRDRLSAISLTIAFALIVTALLLTGIWTVTPWWWPWLCAAIGAIGAVRGSNKAARCWPRGWGWAVTAVALSIAALGGWLTAEGLAGRRVSGPAIDLAFPLSPGNYIVANGGTNLAVSSHAETLDLGVPRHRLWHGQSYGVDIVALNVAGRTSGGLAPTDVERYAIFGRRVVAPCAGLVVATVDGLADSPIPLTGDEPSAGNHVMLRCGPAIILLAHFRLGTVKVRVGQSVTVGQPVAEVGNSGSSGEPHLHIHAQLPGTVAAPFSGRPLPIRISGRNPVRNARF